MGGGDLNLSKSWAVNTMAQQRRTWEAENQALQERKKAEVLRREREEERAVEQLRRLQAESGGSSDLIDPKIAWMYGDQKTGPGPTSDETEQFLLGKRRVDQIILKGDQDQKQDITTKQQDIDPLGAAPSAKDFTIKARLDPLAAIERQRTNNISAMMNDPVMKRRLLRAAVEKREKSDRDDRRDRKRRQRDDSLDQQARSKRIRRSEEDGDHPRSYRHRGRDHHELRSKSPKHSHGQRYATSPSQSPRRGRSASKSRYRSPHSDQRGRDRSEDKTVPSCGNTQGKDERGRSRFLPRDSREHSSRQVQFGRRDRQLSPRSKEKRANWHSTKAKGRGHSPVSPARHRGDTISVSELTSVADVKQVGHPDFADEERSRKLAEMTRNAQDLDEARSKRLAEMDQRERLLQVGEDRRRGSIDPEEFMSGLRGNFVGTTRRI